jgi:hypothetical protein
MSFGLYLVGFLIITIAVAYGLHLLNVPQAWIVVAVMFLVGLGILKGVSRTRHRDPTM